MPDRSVIAVAKLLSSETEADADRLRNHANYVALNCVGSCVGYSVESDRESLCWRVHYHCLHHESLRAVTLAQSERITAHGIPLGRHQRRSVAL